MQLIKDPYQYNPNYQCNNIVNQSKYKETRKTNAFQMEKVKINFTMNKIFNISKIKEILKVQENRKDMMISINIHKV